MPDKIPLRVTVDSNNDTDGVSEFQVGETLGVAHGGTGLSALGTANQILQVNAGATALEFSTFDELDGAIVFTAQASEDIAKGEVVYIDGTAANIPTVSKARANSSATMPAFGVASEAATSGNTFSVVTFGSLTETDTSSFTIGDTLYVSDATAGALTSTAPTGEASLIQNIGRVTRVNANNGVVKIGGAGRTNATPNLNNGNIFIGNGSNQATTSSLNTEVTAILTSGNYATQSYVTSQGYATETYVNSQGFADIGLVIALG